MLRNRHRGLEALLADAQAWAAQAQALAEREGLLKVAHFALYLAVFALLTILFDRNVTSPWVMTLPALALGVAMHRMQRVRQQLMSFELTLIPASQFALPALADFKRQVRTWPLLLQTTVRVTALLAEVNALLARARSIDLMADFRLPQFAALRVATARWLRRLVRAITCAALPMLLDARMRVVVPSLFAARPARPVALTLLC